MVEMKVKTIALDADSKIPLMLLTDLDEKFFLPIYIGGSEARAIGMELEGMNSPRPFTHDLMKVIMDHFNGSIRRVVINNLQESTYFARIVLLREEQEIEIDARPSDAVAMALRFKAPIFVTENVVIEAATPDKGKIAEDNKKFKEFIEHISPEMFQISSPQTGKGS